MILHAFLNSWLSFGYDLPSLQSRPAFGERGLRLGGHPDKDSVCVCVYEYEEGEGEKERGREREKERERERIEVWQVHVGNQ